MIRVERDAAWWLAVLSHPEVKRTLYGERPETVANFVHLATVTPIAAEHGGFLFSQIDALGQVLELHAAFTPEGWGREVNSAGKAALEMVFAGPCALVTACEVRDNPQCRLPKSFGFTAAGDWVETALGETRLSVLTKAAWLASPAKKRMH